LVSYLRLPRPGHPGQTQGPAPGRGRRGQQRRLQPAASKPPGPVLGPAVSRGCIEAINLLPEDYSLSVELNQRYADLPGDFADLTLLTLSERLEIAAE
jgi:hypothetical protein